MREKLKLLKLNHFFSASVLMVFGNNIINLFNYIYHFVMGRMLGPVGYGELATLISLVGLLLIIPTAFGLSITRMVATGSEDPKVRQLLNWILKKTLLCGLIISITFCLFSPVISSFLKISNIWFVIIIGIFFTFSLISYVYKSTLQGLLKFNKLIVAGIGETFAKLILGALFVYLGYGVFGALASILIGAILGLIIAKEFLGNFLETKKSVKPKTEHLKDLFLYSLPVTIYTITQTSLFSSDLILVKHFFSNSDAGLYAALSSLGKIIFFGAGPIIYVMFPMVSQRFAKKQNYHKIFFLSLIFTISVCSFVLVLYYFYPAFVILASVGSQYIQAADVLFLFGLFMSLVSISNLLINFQLSLKRTKVVILPTIAAIAQIAFINYFHSSLIQVIYVSISISLFLLVSLIIFSLTKTDA